MLKKTYMKTTLSKFVATLSTLSPRNKCGVTRSARRNKGGSSKYCSVRNAEINSLRVIGVKLNSISILK